MLQLFAKKIVLLFDELCRMLWPVWLAIAVAVGLSRVCLYSHYPSDVVAGAFLAGAATLLTARFWMLPRLRRIEAASPADASAPRSS